MRPPPRFRQAIRAVCAGRKFLSAEASYELAEHATDDALTAGDSCSAPDRSRQRQRVGLQAGRTSRSRPAHSLISSMRSWTTQLRGPGSSGRDGNPFGGCRHSKATGTLSSCNPIRTALLRAVLDARRPLPGAEAFRPRTAGDSCESLISRQVESAELPLMKARAGMASRSKTGDFQALSPS